MQQSAHVAIILILDRHFLTARLGLEESGWGSIYAQISHNTSWIRIIDERLVLR